MYKTDDLTDIINDYMIDCRNRPTKQGLARKLGLSSATVFNVIRGYFTITFRMEYKQDPEGRLIIATFGLYGVYLMEKANPCG